MILHTCYSQLATYLNPRHEYHRNKKMRDKPFAIEWNCAICLTDQSTTTRAIQKWTRTPCILDGCGQGKHLFCDACVSRLPEKKCPVCAAPFTHALPIQLHVKLAAEIQQFMRKPRTIRQRIYKFVDRLVNSRKSSTVIVLYKTLVVAIMLFSMWASRAIRLALVAYLPGALVDSFMGFVFLFYVFVFITMFPPDNSMSGMRARHSNELSDS
jgi:hypothetical protein